MHHSLSELLLQLSELQQPNGSFCSFSSRDTTNGKLSQDVTAPVDSIYFTSLIVLALSELAVKSTDGKRALLGPVTHIIDRAVTFLLTQESAFTTWNYTPRDLPSSYPDDIDDTFLAISAIESWKKDYLTPERLAHITNTLVRCEVTPGGPYRTWITAANTQPPWNDVDSVVNTMINRWLRNHEIHLTPLQAFVDKHKNGQHRSLYYHNQSFTNYLTHSTSEDACEYVSQILAQEKPFKFYVEKISNTNCYYAHCEAMEIALHIQLLGISENHLSSPMNDVPQTGSLRGDHLVNTSSLYDPSVTSHLSRVRETITTVFSESELMCDFFVKQFDTITIHAPDELLIPYYYYQSLYPDLQERITLPELVTITSAHAIGLISFTLQDSICDYQAPPNQIPYVSSGIVAMETLFQRVLFRIASYEQLQQILHRMNDSLLRETLVTNKALITREDLGTKSLGLVCGIFAIITIVGSEHTHKEQQTMLQIFSLYLSVRQLLDDFHDWPEDITSGRGTLVTQQILAHIHSNHNEPHLTKTPETAHATSVIHHQLFWNSVFPHLYREAMSDLNHCRSLIDSLCTVHTTAFLIDRINHLKHILEKTYSTRNELSQFISSYEKTTRASGVDHA